jgi:hypothetical protein
MMHMHCTLFPLFVAVRYHMWLYVLLMQPTTRASSLPARIMGQLEQLCVLDYKTVHVPKQGGLACVLPLMRSTLHRLAVPAKVESNLAVQPTVVCSRLGSGTTVVSE